MSDMYQSFIFKSYVFDEGNKKLFLNYSFDNKLDFTEEYTFDFIYTDYDRAVLDRALQNLFFMAGISYFKAYAPKKIQIESGKIDNYLADFFSKTYSKGLGEFWYVNKLDPYTKVTFPANCEIINPLNKGSRGGQLIGIGGGKDSLVVAESIKEKHLDNACTWEVNHYSQLSSLVERIETKNYFVNRKIDSRLLDLNSQGALNGHVPLSAILSMIGVVLSVLTGNQDIVVGNEKTASEPDINYRGVAINHQYSKSLEYEKDCQAMLNHCFGDSIRYYSILRPITELRTAEIFANKYFEKYKDVFSSCNRAYTLHSDHLFWCGECPKCAFVYLIFCPFIDETELNSLWRGKNLLRDSLLEPVYRSLLGIEGDRPLDCVGEVKEARAAMRLATAKMPFLKEKYVFELPDDYDYKQIGESLAPEPFQTEFRDYLNSLEF